MDQLLELGISLELPEGRSHLSASSPYLDQTRLEAEAARPSHIGAIAVWPSDGFKGQLPGLCEFLCSP